MKGFVGPFLVVFCLSGATSLAQQAEWDDATAAVENALREMQRWVGEDDNGRRWQRYLRTPQLEAQLERGGEAERAAVEAVLSRYETEIPGLDRRRFVAVRDALRVWLASWPPTPQSLAENASSWKTRYQAVPASVVDERKVELQAALDQLDEFLAGGDPDNAHRWRRYLKSDLVRRHIQTPELGDPSHLQGALSAYYENHPGLAMQPFIRARRALRNFMNAALFHGQRDAAQRVYNERIEELATRLAEPDDLRENSIAIGRILGWLESGQQAESLVTQVRSAFWRPNFHARVSEALVAAGIRDEVSQSQAVNEYILGTTIQGTAHTSGTLDARMVSSPDQAALEIVLDAAAHSNNVGYNGPVTIYSSGVTGLQAAKRVFIDQDGLTTSAAWATGWTSSTIHSIAARSRLVRKIAWKRAASSKTQAEQIAASRAASRVAGEVDLRVAELISSVNEDYREKIHKPLLRLDAFPRELEFSSDVQGLQLRLLHATAYQVAAAAAPPPLEASHDLAVQMHESVVGNFSESILGGRTLTDERLAELMEDAGAEVPEELRIAPDKEPWSITFSVVYPVRVRFREQTVRVSILGQRFTRGDQVIQDAIEIAAAYDLERTGGGSRLTRRGDVEVEYVNRERLSVRHVAMKTFLRKKFDALFESEFVSDGLALPARWQKLGKLQLQSLSSQQGWLALAWTIPDNSTQLATSKN